MDPASPDPRTALAVVEDGGRAIARDPKEELLTFADQIGKEMLDTADVAIKHWADTDEELKKLPPKQRTIARAATLCKSEAPVALLAALDYHKELKHREQTAKGPNENIFIQNNYGISLPAPMAPALDAEVVVIDSDKLRDQE